MDADRTYYQMCKISQEPTLLGERNKPIVGEGDPSRFVIAHYGSMSGSFSGVNLFSDTESPIVVLANTKPLYDITDWTTQLLTQTIFIFLGKKRLCSLVEQDC